MSRLSTEALAIGLGASALALGRRRSVLSRLHAAFGAWGALRSGRSADASADTPADTTAASASDDVDAPDLMVEIDAALRYTEQGALDALRRVLTGDTPATAGPAGARATRRAAIVLDDFWGSTRFCAAISARCPRTTSMRLRVRTLPTCSAPRRPPCRRAGSCATTGARFCERAVTFAAGWHWRGLRRRPGRGREHHAGAAAAAEPRAPGIGGARWVAAGRR